MNPVNEMAGSTVQRGVKEETVMISVKKAAAVAFVLALFGGITMTPGESQAQAPAQAAPPDAPTVVANVQAFYDKTNTFSADFAQMYVVKAYNTTKTSAGHVVFLKPGKMDWVYSDPAGNRIVSDGVQLRVYEAANKQMYQQNVTQSQYPAALAFLTGSGKLATLFNFQLLPGAQMQFPGGYVLVGDPVQPTPAYTKVLFYVDGATWQVRRVLILDGQGNRNRFDFTGAVINQPVPPTQFVFTPPPGTTIVTP